MAKKTTHEEIALACKMHSEGMTVDKICEKINRDRRWFYRNTKGSKASKNKKAETGLKLRSEGMKWKDIYKIAGYKSAESAQSACLSYKKRRSI